MSDDTKPTDSKMITAQKDMVAQMRHDVLPPQSGVNVGGLEPRALPPSDVVRRADEVIPPARGKPE